MVNMINAKEKSQEAWSYEWEKLIKNFDYIKNGLEKIKEQRKDELTALQHRTVINKITDIFEVL
jgi:hypothetical protein